ncbi:MAG: hypothetical protein L6R40_007993 [Gallowayella cf. fulva]|nr:MAG: hypothetical protein L6R40_007993 [Xanthomendoza cf. fulva]
MDVLIITVYSKEHILFGDIKSYLAETATWRSQVVDTTLNRNILSYLPAEGIHWFRFEGQVIMFKRADVEKETENISFWALNPFSGKDVQQMIQKCQESGQRRQGTVTYTAGQKYSRQKGLATWRPFSDQPKRLLDSVILPEGMKDDIRHDLKQWLKDEAYYREVHRTYKRCYCLAGPPGIGKNTLVSAIAGELDRHIYSLHGTTMSDTEVVEILPDLPHHCVLFLEEIDTAFKHHDRSPRQVSEVGITPSLIHAFLDGSLTLTGKFVIIALNDLAALGPTAIRPGRVDRHLTFTLVTKAMAKDLFIYFMGPRYKEQESEKSWTNVEDLADRFAEHLEDGRLSPARIAGFLTDYRNPHAVLQNMFVKHLLVERSRLAAHGIPREGNDFTVGDPISTAGKLCTLPTPECPLGFETLTD